MKEYVKTLYRKNEKGEMFLISPTENIREFLKKLKEKFGSDKELSKILKNDTSSIRRWKRKGMIPLSTIVRFDNEFAEEIGQIIQNLEYVASKSSPKKVKIPKLNPEIGYLIGYISGDGHLKEPTKHDSQWEITIESWTDESRLDYLNDILIRNFGIRGSKTKNNTRRGWRLIISSKIFHKILTEIFKIPTGVKYNLIRVPEIIKNSDSEIKKKYLQGWFDSEGFVTFNKDKLQIEFYVKNNEVTDWIKQELEKNGIKVNKNKRGVIIIRSSQITNFQNLIGFQHRKQLSKLAINTVSGNTRSPSDGQDYWV